MYLLHQLLRLVLHVPVPVPEHKERLERSEMYMTQFQGYPLIDPIQRRILKVFRNRSYTSPPSFGKYHQRAIAKYI